VGGGSGGNSYGSRIRRLGKGQSGVAGRHLGVKGAQGFKGNYSEWGTGEEAFERDRVKKRQREKERDREKKRQAERNRERQREK